MRPVVISALARADLREIGDVIAEDDPGRASRFVVEVRARCRTLGRRPFMGRPAPEIAPEVRVPVFRSYLILHRAHDDRILIDRVLHSACGRTALAPYD